MSQVRKVSARSGMTHSETLDETTPQTNLSPAQVRRIVRFSLDLDKEQHKFLKLFALSNDVKASLVVRSLLYLLETDLNIANRVIDEIMLDE